VNKVKGQRWESKEGKKQVSGGGSEKFRGLS
jgi:hypothetical protein